MKYTIFYKNFVVREENNNTYSFLNKITGQIFFLNSTSSFIFENHEITNLDALVSKLHNLFQEVPKNQIKADCREVLQKMTALGIAKIEGDDKEINKIAVAGEKDYIYISKFINNAFKDDSYLMYGVNQIKDYYNVISVRIRQFNGTEFNFIHYDSSGDIDACLVLGQGTYANVFPVFGIFVKKENISLLNDMINYVFAISPEVNKIRFSAKGDTDNIIINELLKLNFKQEAILMKEIGDMDLKIYSKFK